MENKGDSSKGDKPAAGSDQEVFRDLSSFRKEALKISDSDHARWKEEADRAAHGQPPLPPKPVEDEKTKKEESRWDRIQRQERKKRIAFGLFVVCMVLLVLQLDVGGRIRATLFSNRAPATPASSAPVVTVTSPDTQNLAEGLLVCRFELNHVRAHDTKPFAEEPFRCDWSTVDGPASLFSPTRLTDPLERYIQLVGAGGPTRAQLLAQLAGFVKTATTKGERVLADALDSDLTDVARRGSQLLEPGENFAPTAELPGASRVALATALAELEIGADPALARAHLARAVTEAPPDDPWPAHALALAAQARGQPADAVKALEARHTARPADELTGYELAWLHVQTGKPGDADRVLAKLAEGAHAEVAQLARAVSAAAAKDWARFDEIAGKLEADLSARPKPFQARVSALKGVALLEREPTSPLIREHLTRTLELDRDCTWADLALARFWLSQKMLPEAASSLRRFLRRFPTWVPARRELANVLARGRYNAQALGEFVELMWAEGPKDEYVKGIAFVTSSMGRPDLGRYLLDRARALKGP